MGSHDYSSYTYANFIDAQNLQYYNDRFESLEGKVLSIVFDYVANVSSCNNAKIIYVPAPVNASMYDARVRILNSDGRILQEYNAGPYASKFASNNNSQIKETQADSINLEFFNCYVVDMQFEYWEMRGNLGGFGSFVKQTVIITADQKPVFICLQTGTAIS